ncbi:hypothetical protein D9M71_527010 [compost metagenome]
MIELKRGFWPPAEIEPEARSMKVTRGSRRIRSWMLPPIDGAVSICCWLMLVPEPILVELNTSEPPATATTCTASRLVAATSPVRAALTVPVWFTPRYTPSSVLVPSPDLVMVMV